MNAARRKQIRDIIDRAESLSNLIDELKSDLETIRDEEGEYYDNMPESLQSGDKGEKSAAAVAALDEAIDALDGFDVADFTSYLETATE